MDWLAEKQIKDAGRGHLTRNGAADVLNSLDRARQAQQDHERRTDVQLELREEEFDSEQDSC
jgi:hypothetical protein